MEAGKIETLASELLHDIDVSFGWAPPAKERRRFQYLQPQYDLIREENIVERILLAYNELGSDEQATFQSAVVEALQRCINTWLGISRTLTVVTLAYRVAPTKLPANIWERLLERRDPASRENTGVWLEQLVPLLKEWDVQFDSMRLDWDHIVENVDLSALPTTSEWVLSQLRHFPEKSIDIFRRTRERLHRDRVEISKSWPDPEEIDEILLAALLPTVQPREKAALLQQKGIAINNPSIFDVVHMEAALIERFSLCPGGTPSPDEAYEQKLAEV